MHCMISNKQCRLFCFSVACCFDKSSPTSGVVEGRVTITITASLWKELDSWFLNDTVASFQLEKPTTTCHNDEKHKSYKYFKKNGPKIKTWHVKKKLHASKSLIECYTTCILHTCACKKVLDACTYKHWL